jgi:hypothetical protein
VTRRSCGIQGGEYVEGPATVLASPCEREKPCLFHIPVQGKELT